MPNPSTGELLNIGVVFVDSAGVNHVRMLDYFDRLKCLYNSKFANEAKFLVDVTKEALLAHVELPASNVVLSEQKFASGESPEKVIGELYSATVPLGASRRAERIADARPIAVSTDSVREVVLNELKRISGFKADRIINSEPTMQVVDGDRVYYLDIPLQTFSAMGTIVSTQSQSLGRAELSLHRADTDLQIARKVYQRDALFMYVVRSRVAENLDRFDSLLDEFTWKFSKMGVRMKSYSDAELVAPDIMEDMPV